MSETSTSCRDTNDQLHTHAARDIEAQLDTLLAEARAAGLPDHAALVAIFSWASRRAYDAGGYPAAKAHALNALEAVLMRDVRQKSAA